MSLESKFNRLLNFRCRTRGPTVNDSRVSGRALIYISYDMPELFKLISGDGQWELMNVTVTGEYYGLDR